MQSSSLRKGCWHNGVWTVKLCHYTVEFSIKAFRLEYHSSCRVDFFAYLWYMHNSRHDVSFPADDDMSSSLRCVWTALPASTVGRWTEGLSLCHWHSCHLIQVQWRIRCRNWEILPTWQSIWANSLSFTLMRLGLIRHFFLCLENCTVYCMFWISMKSFGSMVFRWMSHASHEQVSCVDLPQRLQYRSVEAQFGFLQYSDIWYGRYGSISKKLKYTRNL